ncbi:MAG: acyl-CoA thioesterase [Ruminiclostridium sp.]|nr:acyl-CoA thioesterase [Ruminiclostridium sp.]
MEPYIHTVQYYETDRMGITHHSNYIRWMEEARVDYLARHGWHLARLEELGVVSPVTEVECQYRNTTTFADAIAIRVSVVRCTGVRMTLRYEMEKADGTLVFTGKSEHCFLGQGGRIVRLKKEYPELYETLMGLAEES